MEGLNGLRAALAHGTRHAIIQIGSRMEFVRDLPLLMGEVKAESAKSLCDQLTHRSRNFV